jgi:hypothetical protein
MSPTQGATINADFIESHFEEEPDEENDVQVAIFRICIFSFPEKF